VQSFFFKRKLEVPMFLPKTAMHQSVHLRNSGYLHIEGLVKSIK